MNRCGRLIFFVLILAVIPAFGRTWTDSNGKKWEGDFVRVLRGKVLISVAGRNIPVPFGRLSPADQDFVRDILEKQGLGSQLPPRKNPPQSGTAAQPNTSDTPEKRPATEEKPKLGEERSWTDKQGRTIQARLIGMDGEKVVLQVKGKPLPYPFDGFSAADQEYVPRKWSPAATAARYRALLRRRMSVPRLRERRLLRSHRRRHPRHRSPLRQSLRSRSRRSLNRRLPAQRPRPCVRR